MQNTFVKLWERKETFEDEDYARKWLIRVAVNECNSLWRSAWKRHTSYLEELTEEPVFSTGKEQSVLCGAGPPSQIPANRAPLLF